MPTEPLLVPLAYLDPGSGSMLLQMLLAGVAGIFVFMKFQGRRFMSLFSRTPDDASDEQPPEDGGES